MNFSDHHVYITVKDYSVSGEEFELLLDKELQLLKTHPQPAPEQLGRYYESEDYISHTDSKRTLFEKLYHIVKQKALRDKVKLIQKFHPSKGILLDIGAGTGDFLVEAKRNNWVVTGIEPNEKARGIAESKGISFKDSVKDVADGSVDVVTMWHVLEHVPNLEEHIKQLKRIIKPDGVIVIAVPNYKSYDAKKYGKYWAAYDVPRHLWHFSKTSIQKLFETEGIGLVKILPMKFDSFYVSLLSEKYKTGKINFIRGFLSGLRSNIRASKNFEYSSHIYLLKQVKK